MIFFQLKETLDTLKAEYLFKTEYKFLFPPVLRKFKKQCHIVREDDF